MRLAILHDAVAARALREAGARESESLEKANADGRLIKHLREGTFLRQPGVEATNWQAENAIRPAVVKRTVRGGNRGWYSAETQQILLTLFRTAYQQGVRRDHDRSAPSPQPTIAPLANRQARFLNTAILADLSVKQV